MGLLILIYNNIALLAIFAILLLALYIYLRNPEERGAIVFSLFLFAAAVGSLAEYLIMNILSAEAANIIVRIGCCFWSLAMGLFFIFALIFSEQVQLLRYRLTYFILFLPPLIISALLLFTNLMMTGMVRQWSGFVPIYNTYYILYILQMVFYIIAADVYILYFCFRTRTAACVRRGILIVIGILFPFIYGVIISNILPYLFHLWALLPPYSSIPFLITSLIIFYAIFQYRLFVILPSHAVPAIAFTLPMAMITTNIEGKISYCNDAAVKLFKDELINKNIIELSQEGMIGDKINNMVVNKKQYERFEASLQKRDGTIFPADIIWSTILEQNGPSIGWLCVVNDISANVKLKQQILAKQIELQNKTRYIERTNKLMNSRDKIFEEQEGELNKLRKEFDLPPY